MSATLVRIESYRVLLDVPTNRQCAIHSDHFSLAWPAIRFHKEEHWPTFPAIKRASEQMPQRKADSLSLNMLEVADLSDGTAVLIRSDRGFSCSTRSGIPYSQSEAIDTVRGLVLETALDEEDERYSELYASEWLVPRLLGLYGVNIAPHSVATALNKPLLVEFSDRASAMLNPAP